MQNKQQQTNNLRTALSIRCPEAIQGEEEEQLWGQLTESQQILSLSIPGVPAAQTGSFLIREQHWNTQLSSQSLSSHTSMSCPPHRVTTGGNETVKILFF